MKCRRRHQGLRRSPAASVVDVEVAESSGPYSSSDSNAAVFIQRTAAYAVLGVLSGASSLLLSPLTPPLMSS